MSEEISDYTQMLRDFAHALDIPSKKTVHRDYGMSFRDREEVSIPDSQLRDSIMRRLGELKQSERRMMHLEDRNEPTQQAHDDEWALGI